MARTGLPERAVRSVDDRGKTELDAAGEHDLLGSKCRVQANVVNASTSTNWRVTCQEGVERRSDPSSIEGIEVMISRADFSKFCKQCVRETVRQGSEYLDEHLLRFWNTYRVCEGLIDTGGSMISVGAGSAYVEHALAHFKRVAVTVIDYPAAIEAHALDYARSGFTTIAHDLTRPLELAGKFDLALSSEIIEHLPQEPQRHIALLRQWLKHGDREAGHLVLTTPNFANLRNVMRLALMKPIMPPAGAVFAEVCFENEGVHRREYVPSEIASAFADCGLRHTHTFFTENGVPSTLKDQLFAFASKVSGRLSQTMILVGQC